MYILVSFVVDTRKLINIDRSDPNFCCIFPLPALAQKHHQGERKVKARSKNVSNSFYGHICDQRCPSLMVNNGLSHSISFYEEESGSATPLLYIIYCKSYIWPILKMPLSKLTFQKCTSIHPPHSRYIFYPMFKITFQ